MRALAILVVYSLCGCSAFGLDEFERCDEVGDGQTSADRCAAALNEEVGLPASCRAFQCVEGLCVRDDAERCDGMDNDCDGDVDEGEFGPSEYRGVGFEDTAARLGVVSNGTDANAFWVEGEQGLYENASTAPLGPAPGESTSLRYRRHDVRSGIEVPVVELADGCWQRTLDPFEAPPIVGANAGACNYRAIEAARSATQTLALSVDASLSGEVLRVGRVDEMGGFHQVGPFTRSNAFLGLGLTEDGRFSAANPGECQAALDAIGASGPGAMCDSSAECPAGECVCGQCLSPERTAAALRCGFADFGFAARDTEVGVASQLGTLGIIAAVSGSLDDAACRTPNFASTPEDDSLRDVALFGVRYEPLLTGEVINASDEGRPHVLSPQTTGIGKPAVLAAGDSFVVAYPGPEQTLALHFLSGDMPAAVARSECESLAGDEQACADPAIPVCEDTLCGSGVGVCVSGAPTCSAGASVCLGARNPDALEGCDNGVDDDCDGRTDEADCTPERSAMAQSESCNGVDDDFDGNVDEDATGMLENASALTNPAPAGPIMARVGDTCGEDDGACTTGIVECRGGRLFCTGGRVPHRNNGANFQDICGTDQDDDCDGDNAEATCDGETSDESCNGRDDDRDGRIDEDVDANVDPSLVIRPRESGVVRQCIATPPLSEVSGDRGMGFELPFDDVVLAVGSESAEGLQMGMAYREILPDGGTRIAFRILTFHNECRCVGDGSCGSESCRPVLTPTALRSSGDPIAVSEDGDHGPPTLVYAATGFRSDETGGWYVLWTYDDGSRRSLLGRRVAEATGEAVDDAPFVASGEGEAFGPQAFTTEMGASYVFVDQSERQIVSARLICTP